MCGSFFIKGIKNKILIIKTNINITLAYIDKIEFKVKYMIYFKNINIY